ncbi:MAG: siderophore-interacting protein [Patulibacter sp.]|nr:siderophore-interacting protein [Patulibacter sp.]
MATPARPTRRMLRTEVVEVERLTPHMYRVVVTGDDLADFAVGDCTDHYVKVTFPGPGATYRAPFDVEQVKAEHPKAQWPRTRSYTVRAWDPATRRLTLDFVYHGDLGVGGPWVAQAQPGDVLQLVGPGGDYAPRPDADWHLLIGDECVVPSIAVALERIPAGRRAIAVIEIEGAAEELPLPTAADARIVWVHRSASADDDRLLRAVEALEFPAGNVHAFLHGEATSVRTIRRHLLAERGIPRDALSVSGYWKRSRDDEGWRAEKAAWKAAVESDVA